MFSEHGKCWATDKDSTFFTTEGKHCFQVVKADLSFSCHWTFLHKEFLRLLFIVDSIGVMKHWIFWLLTLNFFLMVILCLCCIFWVCTIMWSTALILNIQNQRQCQLFYKHKEYHDMNRIIRKWYFPVFQTCCFFFWAGGVKI